MKADKRSPSHLLMMFTISSLARNYLFAQEAALDYNEIIHETVLYAVINLTLITAITNANLENRENLHRAFMRLIARVVSALLSLLMTLALVISLAHNKNICEYDIKNETSCLN